MAKHIKSFSIVSLGTLTSRILGMIRDILMASSFGASLILDSFLLAFMIPNLFRKFFGEGAISAAFLPVFTDVLENEGEKKAEELANTVLTILGTILGTIVVLGFIISYFWPIIFPTSEKAQLALKLLQVMMPYLFFICMTAFLSSILNSLQHFFMPTLAPIILNICWLSAILAIPFLGKDKTIWAYAMAGAISLSGIIQYLLQIPILRKKNIHIQALWNPYHPHLKRILINFLPILVSATIVQLNMLLDLVVAWCLIPGHGAVSIMYMGNRLMQFPLALIGISLATVAFPIFARHVVRKEKHKFGEAVTNTLQISLMLTIPAAVGLICLAQPIIRLLYLYNRFTEEAALRTTNVLIAYSLGIPLFVFIQILSKAFYSLEDTKTPTKIALGALFCNLTLNLLLVPYYQELGLAIATSITSLGNAATLFFLLHKKIPLYRRKLLKTSCITIGNTFIMLCAVLITQYFLPTNDTIYTRLLQVIVPITVGIVTYGICQYITTFRHRNILAL
ncbi:MAG TPA: murein biosynthesis integral membrane protein MurJ [Planctomycetota bacterium]|nr:murein biosynthesis integral membrane protein MurJ [Planctomycetota bacterium]HQB01450.1 murein biosynthesis integral membrane protein MurJ [Planctomycetota bacterium]